MMKHKKEVIRLDKSHEAGAVSILIRAFKKDPLFLHAFKTPEQAVIFATYLYQKAINQREILLGTGERNWLKGVANLEKRKIRFSLTLLKPSFLLLSYHCFRFLPKQSFRFFNRCMRFTTQQRPKGPHYYLNWIGVDPAAQGSGVGSKILAYIHQIVDTDHMVTGIGLDTENPGNVSYYEKFGYKATATANVEGVKIFTMFRPRM